MKKLLAVALVAGGLGITSAALANPIIAPISGPAPVVVSTPVTSVPIQTQVLNGYRAVRSFWLSRAIVR